MGDNKIDITSTLLESTVDGAKGFLGKLLGASVEEYGLMLAENVKLKRFKNQLKMVNKAHKIVEESGINIKQISIKQLVPLLEFSSLEEDESIQDKWANMLVNFVDANQVYESSIYPYLLSQLSSNEIFELEKLFVEKINKPFVVSIKDIQINNLVRLGLIELIEVQPSHNFFIKQNISYLDYISHSVVHNLKTYIITELGLEFVKCCSRSINENIND